MRKLVLTLGCVLVVAGLAGCIGDEDVSPASTDQPGTPANRTGQAANASLPALSDGTPAPEELLFRDCSLQFGFLPVPTSDYEHRRPEGFSFVPYPGDPTGEGVPLVTYGQACETVEGTPIAWSMQFLLVEPPEVWQADEEVFGHGLVVSIVTNSDHQAEVNEAWGLGPVTTTGDVSLKKVETPAGTLGLLEVDGGDRSITMQTRVDGETGASQANSARLFAVDQEGTVTGAHEERWTRNNVTTGEASLSSPDRATTSGTAVTTGFGAFNLGLDRTHSYIDLPPRAES